MRNRDLALQAIYRAIDALNLQLPRERRIDRTPEAPLAGPGRPLDSLALVNLAVAVEAEAQSALGVEISIVDRLAESADPGNPFETAGALADLVAGLAAEAGLGA